MHTRICGRVGTRNKTPSTSTPPLSSYLSPSDSHSTQHTTAHPGQQQHRERRGGRKIYHTSLYPNIHSHSHNPPHSSARVTTLLHRPLLLLLLLLLLLHSLVPAVEASIAFPDGSGEVVGKVQEPILLERTNEAPEAVLEKDKVPELMAAERIDAPEVVVDPLTVKRTIEVPDEELKEKTMATDTVDVTVDLAAESVELKEKPSEESGKVTTEMSIEEFDPFLDEWELVDPDIDSTGEEESNEEEINIKRPSATPQGPPFRSEGRLSTSVEDYPPEGQAKPIVCGLVDWQKKPVTRCDYQPGVTPVGSFDLYLLDEFVLSDHASVKLAPVGISSVTVEGNNVDLSGLQIEKMFDTQKDFYMLNLRNANLDRLNLEELYWKLPFLKTLILNGNPKLPEKDLLGVKSWKTMLQELQLSGIPLDFRALLYHPMEPTKMTELLLLNLDHTQTSWIPYQKELDYRFPKLEYFYVRSMKKSPTSDHKLLRRPVIVNTWINCCDLRSLELQNNNGLVPGGTLHGPKKITTWGERSNILPSNSPVRSLTLDQVDAHNAHDDDQICEEKTISTGFVMRKQITRKQYDYDLILNARSSCPLVHPDAFLTSNPKSRPFEVDPTMGNALAIAKKLQIEYVPKINLCDLTGVECTVDPIQASEKMFLDAHTEDAGSGFERPQVPPDPFVEFARVRIRGDLLKKEEFFGKHVYCPYTQLSLLEISDYIEEKNPGNPNSQMLLPSDLFSLAAPVYVYSLILTNHSPLREEINNNNNNNNDNNKNLLLPTESILHENYQWWAKDIVHVDQIRIQYNGGSKSKSTSSSSSSSGAGSSDQYYFKGDLHLGFIKKNYQQYLDTLIVDNLPTESSGEVFLSIASKTNRWETLRRLVFFRCLGLHQLPTGLAYARSFPKLRDLLLTGTPLDGDSISRELFERVPRIGLRQVRESQKKRAERLGLDGFSSSMVTACCDYKMEGEGSKSNLLEGMKSPANLLISDDQQQLKDNFPDLVQIGDEDLCSDEYGRAVTVKDYQQKEFDLAECARKKDPYALTAKPKPAAAGLSDTEPDPDPLAVDLCSFEIESASKTAATCVVDDLSGVAVVINANLGEIIKMYPNAVIPYLYVTEISVFAGNGDGKSINLDGINLQKLIHPKARDYVKGIYLPSARIASFQPEINTLKGFRNLKEIDLSGNGITNAGLTNLLLEPRGALTAVKISSCQQLSDPLLKVFVPLGPFGNLQRLEMAATRTKHVYSEDSLPDPARMQSLFPELTVLNLERNEMTMIDLRPLIYARLLQGLHVLNQEKMEQLPDDGEFEMILLATPTMKCSDLNNRGDGTSALEGKQMNLLFNEALKNRALLVFNSNLDAKPTQEPGIICDSKTVKQFIDYAADEKLYAIVVEVKERVTGTDQEYTDFDESRYDRMAEYFNIGGKSEKKANDQDGGAVLVEDNTVCGLMSKKIQAVNCNEEIVKLTEDMRIPPTMDWSRMELIPTKTFRAENIFMTRIDAQMFRKGGVGLNLENLELVNTHLGMFPSGFFSLEQNNFPKLKRLVLNGNPFQELPPATFEGISNTLEELHLQQMPNLDWASVGKLIGKLPKLHTLDISKNKRINPVHDLSTFTLSQFNTPLRNFNAASAGLRELPPFPIAENAESLLKSFSMHLSGNEFRCAGLENWIAMHSYDDLKRLTKDIQYVSCQIPVPATYNIHKEAVSDMWTYVQMITPSGGSSSDRALLFPLGYMTPTQFTEETRLCKRVQCLHQATECRRTNPSTWKAYAQCECKQPVEEDDSSSRGSSSRDNDNQGTVVVCPQEEQQCVVVDGSPQCVQTIKPYTRVCNEAQVQVSSSPPGIAKVRSVATRHFWVTPYQDISLNGITNSFFLLCRKTLIKLDLSGARLESLDTNLLEGMEVLEEIDLSGNPFTSIPEKFFEPVKGTIKKITFNKVSVDSIPDNLFANSRELEELEISGLYTKSRFSGIGNSLVKGCFKLKQLSIRNNYAFKMMPKSFLVDNPVIQKLTICSTGLAILPKKLTGAHPFLRHFDLKENHLLRNVSLSVLGTPKEILEMMADPMRFVKIQDSKHINQLAALKSPVITGDETQQDERVPMQENGSMGLQNPLLLLGTRIIFDLSQCTVLSELPKGIAEYANAGVPITFKLEGSKKLLCCVIAGQIEGIEDIDGLVDDMFDSRARCTYDRSSSLTTTLNSDYIKQAIAKGFPFCDLCLDSTLLDYGFCEPKQYLSRSSSLVSKRDRTSYASIKKSSERGSENKNDNQDGNAEQDEEEEFVATGKETLVGLGESDLSLPIPQCRTINMYTRERKHVCVCPEGSCNGRPCVVEKDKSITCMCEVGEIVDPVSRRCMPDPCVEARTTFGYCLNGICEYSPLEDQLSCLCNTTEGWFGPVSKKYAMHPYEEDSCIRDRCLEGTPTPESGGEPGFVTDPCPADSTCIFNEIDQTYETFCISNNYQETLKDGKDLILTFRDLGAESRGPLTKAQYRDLALESLAAINDVLLKDKEFLGLQKEVLSVLAKSKESDDTPTQKKNAISELVPTSRTKSRFSFTFKNFFKVYTKMPKTDEDAAAMGCTNPNMVCLKFSIKKDYRVLFGEYEYDVEEEGAQDEDYSKDEDANNPDAGEAVDANSSGDAMFAQRKRRDEASHMSRSYATSPNDLDGWWSSRKRHVRRLYGGTSDSSAPKTNKRNYNRSSQRKGKRSSSGDIDVTGAVYVKTLNLLSRKVVDNGEFITTRLSEQGIEGLTVEEFRTKSKSLVVMPVKTKEEMAAKQQAICTQNRCTEMSEPGKDMYAMYDSVCEFDSREDVKDRRGCFDHPTRGARACVYCGIPEMQTQNITSDWNATSGDVAMVMTNIKVTCSKCVYDQFNLEYKDAIHAPNWYAKRNEIAQNELDQAQEDAQKSNAAADVDQGSSSGLSTEDIIIICVVVPLGALLIAGGVIFAYWWMVKRPKKKLLIQQQDNDLGRFNIASSLDGGAARPLLGGSEQPKYDEQEEQAVMDIDDVDGDKNDKKKPEQHVGAADIDDGLNPAVYESTADVMASVIGEEICDDDDDDAAPGGDDEDNDDASIQHYMREVAHDVTKFTSSLSLAGKSVIDITKTWIGSENKDGPEKETEKEHSSEAERKDTTPLESSPPVVEDRGQSTSMGLAGPTADNEKSEEETGV
eukprot:Nk52_evm7s258 gene=Nk52_evmTU7s258